MTRFKGTPGPWVGKSVEIFKQDDAGLQLSFIHTSDEQRREEAAANAKLIVMSPELVKALEWALPLAKIAMDAHRMERIKCGHKDISGTYKNGETWVGIWQNEVDQIEFAQEVLNKALEK